MTTYSKANIITMIGTLAVELQDSTTLSRFFDDVIEQNGITDRAISIEVDYGPAVVAGTATYSFPSDVLRLHHALMLGTPLSFVDERDLEAYSKTWRTATGTPIALSCDELNRQYTFYPIPTASSATALVIVYGAKMAAAFLSYNALPLAFLTLAKEFTYSSHHQDIDFAENCNLIAELLFTLNEVRLG